MARRHFSNQQVREPITQAIKPLELKRIELGTFPADKPPIGFSIDFEPKPEPRKSVVVLVEALEAEQGLRYVCLIHNYGIRTVTAVIRQLPKRRSAHDDADLWLHDDGHGGCLEVRMVDRG